MTRVSVIIPCYNRADLIGQTLDSVLGQTVPPDEVWVIDDGSRDASVAVVEDYVRKSNGIVRLVQQANAGPSVARNAGLERATGQYIAFCDADDLWLPDKLQKQLAVMDAEAHHWLAGVYCRLFKFRMNLDDMNRTPVVGPVDEPSVEQVLMRMCIQASAALVRGQVARSIRFQHDARDAEDAMYFAQARLHGAWRLIDEPLVGYRAHEGQATSDPWHYVRSTQARADWLARHAQAVGPTRAAELEKQLWQELIGALEKRYWQRQFDDLDAMCRVVTGRAPELMAASVLAKRRRYPRWVYALRDRWWR
ncbi:MAG: glycosyltransferase family 2 protein [Phycisphaeraceae bacterium]